MTIIATMTASLTSKCMSKGDQLTDNPFEDIGPGRNKGRSARTGSLALPNNSLLDLYDQQQEQCNSIALLPSNVNVRRHSSHCCPIIDDKQATPELKNLQIQANSTHYSTTATSINLLPPTVTTLIPPPVPKRTFKGKITSKQIFNNSYNSNSLSSGADNSGSDGGDGIGGINNFVTAVTNSSTSIYATPSFQHNQSMNINSEQNHHHHHHLQQSSYNNFMTIKSSSHQNRDTNSLLTEIPTTRYTINVTSNQIPDDDRMSLENCVFDETTTNNVRTTEISKIIQPNTMMSANNSRHSNHSSSDSNKSQTTADTGYLSNDNEKIYQNDIRNYRSRFSSVDTQSSFDSCLTEKTIDSPLSKDSFKIDSGHSSQNEFSTISNIQNQQQQQTSSSPSSTTTTASFYPLMNKTIKNLPAVPVRRQISSVASKIPPPILSSSSSSLCNTLSNNDNNKIRTIPPTPPLRSQQSMDSTASNNCYVNNNLSLANNNLHKQPQQKIQNQNNAKNDDNNLTTNNTSQCNNALNKSINAVRNKLNKNKPPPIKTHQKLHQRQDSSISSDSMTSSPGYNCKSMEAPLLQHQSKINKSNHPHNHHHIMKHQDSNDSFSMTSRYNWPSSKSNLRQDSSLSSDSFSQTSSPGYNTKLMEAPLLLQAIKMNNAVKQNFRAPSEISKESIEHQPIPTSPITKSASTPASLQTIVRFQNGSNMSLQHRIINRRKSSNPYVTQGRLKFRLFQILLNAVALLAIAGGLAAYFNAYPTVKFINKTIITPSKSIDDNRIEIGKNPAPGVCLPIIVKFCQNHQLPYNYTVFPNYMGHFGQPEAQVVLEAYDALVDVRCYELVSLFLCTLFVPKCGPTGTTVPPCKTLCTETMRRCGFFFSVFGLELPDYLTCNLFTDTNDPDGCVGLAQVREARMRALNPVCSGFLCDQKRCIPSDWRCDGHVDCQDQTDESQCNFCGKGSIYCGEKRCMSQKHICDGIMDCPYGQDERNCIRLSERNGDLGKGTLEVYKSDVKLWAPACVSHWDSATSPSAVCSMLGYSSVNSSRLTMRGSNMTMLTSVNESPAMWRMYQKKHSNLMKEFSSCSVNGHYPVVELTCTNFDCGKIRNKKFRSSRRIVGGQTSNPGDWPFLAAILGGPEEIFYCAGVLIADQWVLTASHCIGNHTLRNINDWTIQLGVTRRHSHTYYGQKVKVLNVIPHPQYNSDIAHDNDIALFQLATRVAFHEHLLPVCLPPSGMDEVKPGTICTVIGWGKREDKNLNPSAASASYEPSVNEVQVPVLNRDLCNEWLDTPNVTEGMICAGYENGGRDACQGDSGGPLLCPFPNERDRWFVGGIVSWGIMCAHPKLPGVYANVPKYIPWITEEMNRYSSNSNYDNNFGY